MFLQPLVSCVKNFEFPDKDQSPLQLMLSDKEQAPILFSRLCFNSPTQDNLKRRRNTQIVSHTVF